MKDEARRREGWSGSGSEEQLGARPDGAPPSSRRARQSPDDGRTALQRIEAELETADTRGVVVCVDIPTATAALLGALPRVLSLREAMRTELPSFEVAALDRLEDYARALQHLHALCAASADGAAGTAADALEAETLRDDLLVAAEALARRGLVDRARLIALRSRPGRRIPGRDLADLVAIFRERWAALEGKTAIESADLDRAEALALEHPPRRTARPARDRHEARLAAQRLLDRRTRCFALLVRAHDECRHALAWVRRAHGDANELLPGLHAGGGRRRSTQSRPPLKAEPEPGETARQAMPAA
ncbi:MAG: hypothetical protein WKG00_41650 [Polyangiaceae bacterium]